MMWSTAREHRSSRLPPHPESTTAAIVTAV